jgi:hypothetical protein
LKNSLKNKLRGILGVFLMIMAIGGIYYWENYGREDILYRQVVISKEDIHRNDMINDQNVELVKIEEFLINPQTARTIESIIGQEAKQFIPQGTIVDRNYLGYSYLIPKENQVIFEIPKEWIYNSPQTLRRGDEIILFPIKKEGNGPKNSATAEYEKASFENEDDDEAVQEKIMAVAYVKDGSNYEVEDENRVGVDRLYGSAVIKSIEVLATQEEIKELEGLVKQEYRFIIAYRNRKVN